MGINLKNLFNKKKTTVREEENRNFNAVAVLEKTNKLDLVGIISRRKNINLEKIINTDKINEEYEKYKQMILNSKNKGATERQLMNLREKMQELVIEKQKIEVLIEVINLDNYIKTAYGKKRQEEIYNTLFKRYNNKQLDLVKFKETIIDLKETLKSTTDLRTETQRLEDFLTSLF